MAVISNSNNLYARIDIRPVLFNVVFVLFQELYQWLKAVDPQNGGAYLTPMRSLLILSMRQFESPF